MWPPFVFVLMPFDPAFDSLYHSVIKPACQEAGAIIERVDEQIFRETILQRVYDQVRTADVIVAVMTARNANVFYEVGYAHALGKTVILLTASISDIPFDLKHFPHIIYGDELARAKTELFRQICHWTGQRPIPTANSAPKIRAKRDPTVSHTLARMWLVAGALLFGSIGVGTQTVAGMALGVAMALMFLTVAYYSLYRRRAAYAAFLAAHLLLCLVFVLCVSGAAFAEHWQAVSFYAVFLIPQAVLCTIVIRSTHIKKYYRQRPRAGWKTSE